MQMPRKESSSKKKEATTAATMTAVVLLSPPSPPARPTLEVGVIFVVAILLVNTEMLLLKFVIAPILIHDHLILITNKH